MSTRPHGETFTRRDIGNSEALSGARVKCLQCGLYQSQVLQGGRYRVNCLYQAVPIATKGSLHVFAQSLEQSLTTARLTRFVHRNVSANP